MKTKKIKIVTEVEIEYNPKLISIDDILSEIDYSFNVLEGHADVAKIKDTEIIDWH
ncbi:hypothetical protein [Bacteroides sp. 51]|uniref:hypothetical protein n=1 Tax=Bacteroides sp. 51 TaxID=2302938 RepID=UPI0013D473F3|nr:hypothetical protein [Bacteroides sp. 51]